MHELEFVKTTSTHLFIVASISCYSSCPQAASTIGAHRLNPDEGEGCCVVLWDQVRMQLIFLFFYARTRICKSTRLFIAASISCYSSCPQAASTIRTHRLNLDARLQNEITCDLGRYDRYIATLNDASDTAQQHAKNEIQPANDTAVQLFDNEEQPAVEDEVM